MADMSRVNEKMATIEQKVAELVSFKRNVEAGGDGGHQAEVDAIESRLDSIIASFSS